MPTAARHYELSDWIDYVRRAGSPEHLGAMENHLLVERCERCARLAQMLEAAYGAARDLGNVDVPEATAQRAQQIFTRTPQQAWRDLAVRVGDWVEDFMISGGGPGWAPAGVRSASAQRQHLFRAGSLQARLETRQADGERLVTGVVSDLSDPGAQWQGTRVLLVNGSRTLAETAANEFGEFELSTASGVELRLVLVLAKSGEILDVVLDR